MKKEKLKIIFIRTAEFGAIILEKMIENNYWPILLISAPDKPVGRKQIITPPPVKLVAKKYNLLIEQPEKIKDLELKIKNLKPDLIILASYSQIIPKKILNIPRYDSLNIHPSLLPKYRGPSPIQTTILNGDFETGVTIIKMTEKIDAGPIVARIKIKNQSWLKMNYLELHNKLAELGGKLLIKTIPQWVEGKIKPKPQDEKMATYTKLFKKEDGLIDWQKSPEVIERQIRALNPWPGTYTIYQGKMLKILEAEIINNKLILKKVQLAGKKPTSFENFLRGHQDFKF